MLSPIQPALRRAALHVSSAPLALTALLAAACSSSPAPPPADPAPTAAPPATAEIPTIPAPAEPAEPVAVHTHTPSPPDVAARHRKECDAGDKVACHAAALDAYYSPPGPDTDRAALADFTKACDAGYAPSCNGLGVLYTEGRGVQKDPVRAASSTALPVKGRVHRLRAPRLGPLLRNRCGQGRGRRRPRPRPGQVRIRRHAREEQARKVPLARRPSARSCRHGRRSFRLPAATLPRRPPLPDPPPAALLDGAGHVG
ncbi:MAG: hypothetical protein R3B70_02810 [Polyangiaceae bacterium]